MFALLAIFILLQGVTGNLSGGQPKEIVEPDVSSPLGMAFGC